jgi:uncharacterized membrane protein
MSNQLKKQKTEVNQGHSSVTVEKHEYYSGSIPKSDELAKYNEINPGFADRLISLVEKEQQGRINLQNEIVKVEKEVMLANISSQNKGLYVGFASVLAILGFCSYLAFLGDTNAAGITVVGTVIGLAGVFVIRRYSKKEIDKEVDKSSN